MRNILTEKNSIRILIGGFILLIIAILIFVWKDWFFSFDSKIQSDKIAQFGDFVGGLIGSLWALAGVMLFYVALSEQRKDFQTNRMVLDAQTDALKQQIKEFELQREELSETREVFKIQSKTLKKQQFESTFFNLVNLHHQIVNSIDLKSTRNKYDLIERMRNRDHHGNKPPNEKILEITTGRDCFVRFRNGLKYLYFEKDEKREANSINEIDFVKKVYDEYYEKHQSDLGHYFRNLYHTFKFIKNSDIENKQMYASLVRAQLSNDELFMIFYNGLSDMGKKFKPLIEEFKILKTLNPKTLIDMKEHYHLYKNSGMQ
ncbi:putative phage abortive infection protein [Christiangramia sp.]|uniref:putative phage abortive infection protein n=1 Tax=Christiangramia sp. TaxID=1931228 RepID=UPI00261BC2FE|nr:putative phage abortive infection protein [Christiangramia sp.]